MGLRTDLEVISQWIEPGTRVLDLGCGDGELLDYLSQTRNVCGVGVEIAPALVNACIARGVDVLQIDIDSGLHAFEDKSFDYVVMSQALQVLKQPDHALAEILRIGKSGIVTFPNFAHWRARLALGLGRMPTTPALPKLWYSTDNIHMCTVRDFDALLDERRWTCLRRSVVDHQHRDRLRHRLMPNVFGEIATYMLRGLEPKCSL